MPATKRPGASVSIPLICGLKVKYKAEELEEYSTCAKIAQVLAEGYMDNEIEIKNILNFETMKKVLK